MLAQKQDPHWLVCGIAWHRCQPAAVASHSRHRPEQHSARYGRATLRLLTFNIWNRFKQNLNAPAQLLIPGNYDAVLFQEESGSRYVTDLPGLL